MLILSLVIAAIGVIVAIGGNVRATPEWITAQNVPAMSLRTTDGCADVVAGNGIAVGLFGSLFAAAWTLERRRKV